MLCGLPEVRGGHGTYTGPWKTIFLYKGVLVSFHDCWREGIDFNNLALNRTDSKGFRL